MTPARILIIAGSDSGGGAGIQADLKTVILLGGFGMTAITAITAQNTLGVQGVHPIPADMVLAQMESCISDIGVDAVKIGMIGSAETANAVADFLSSSFPRKRGTLSQPLDAMQDREMHTRQRGDDGQREIPIVFDPVMVATSGSMLADDATVAAFEKLMAIATLVTPNIPELAALGGEEIAVRFGTHILAKGGHGEGPMLTDRLLAPTGVLKAWSNMRIDTPHTHGTGCTLASAIATGLGQGLDLIEAIERGRKYVREALRLAPGFGAGHGPMGAPFGFHAYA
ncbi:hydroxymethylpyrimidine/phosphomethylpyrimidine kinase [Sphingobium sp. BYY-5]|uniref:bifunctional hydroxymethylpyrimidine kinase/phosphomethylpyrimidine kinase n=1 Tax=Sphingobium sp. BYY-5 TaxID=2926400 RepID=UPI001FA74A91|nr:bifunctional hydroxymethylpyrimidine kinase/phosphomethylpyrimidine kinase [Sphingobium sp. BYY-5]MCI4589612.1 hydroxymethylpyrimidine/phosphomethylpyrimidine kinase [Sphingobium sp. BYY-5]